ncbi:hypothetical protein PoB_000692700 [Plakobranchus ocellatus]|uniref:Uncharacterized protein n=1 Tax=Plakobranchus ocellatus TaxID=259542 RepID=A0AAV3YE57_9GAST|nr:hypothetical protein PoB_000692700 [Plakobranchus ocellatus]
MLVRYYNSTPKPRLPNPVVASLGLILITSKYNFRNYSLIEVLWKSSASIAVRVTGNLHNLRQLIKETSI